MDKIYFAAKIHQEFADVVRNKAISIGVPEENILLSTKACKVMHLGIYIKFDDIDTYNEFISWDIPGIIERW